MSIYYILEDSCFKTAIKLRLLILFNKFYTEQHPNL